MWLFRGVIKKVWHGMGWANAFKKTVQEHKTEVQERKTEKSNKVNEQLDKLNKNTKKYSGREKDILEYVNFWINNHRIGTTDYTQSDKDREKVITTIENDITNINTSLDNIKTYNTKTLFKRSRFNKAEINAIKSKIKEIKEEKTQYKEELTSKEYLETARNSINNNYINNIKQDSIGGILRTIKNKNNEVKRATTKLKKLEEKLKELKNETSNSIVDNEEDNEEQSSKIEEKITNLNSEITNLNSEITNLNSEITRIASLNSNLKKIKLQTELENKEHDETPKKTKVTRFEEDSRVKIILNEKDDKGEQKLAGEEIKIFKIPTKNESTGKTTRKKMKTIQQIKGGLQNKKRQLENINDNNDLTKEIEKIEKETDSNIGTGQFLVNQATEEQLEAVIITKGIESKKYDASAQPKKSALKQSNKSQRISGTNLQSETIGSPYSPSTTSIDKSLQLKTVQIGQK